ncbi:MAG: D-aminoacyl-tRNA deacylase [Candidatus Kapabacteria bacterium]|nr:D-aminoacyl-tRNA deacylase [Candidatus Kapabacteria bacterium]
MKAVVQRVKRAKVAVDGDIIGEIGFGLLVLIGIKEGDNNETIRWMSNKLVNLRIFPDDDDKMNLSVSDVGGGILVISNFTVYGDVNKGFRPNFMAAAAPEISEPIYNELLNYLRNNYNLKIEAGKFGAMMEIELVNDGPVTIVIVND